MFDLGDVHAALGIKGVEGVGVTLNELIDDGHDVAVSVLDDVEAMVAVTFDELVKVRGNELGELGGAEERSGVEAVVGAEGEAVEAAVVAVLEGLVEGVADSLGGFRVNFFGLVGEAKGEVVHAGAAGDAEGRVAVAHDEVAISGYFADEVDKM